MHDCWQRQAAAAAAAAAVVVVVVVVVDDDDDDDDAVVFLLLPLKGGRATWLQKDASGQVAPWAQPRAHVRPAS